MTEIRKYRPSCGSEGADFIDRWCYSCKRDKAFREEDGDSCLIVANSFVYEVDDPRYPAEWTFNYAGEPICTAFEDEDAPDKQDPNAAVRDLFA